WCSITATGGGSCATARSRTTPCRTWRSLPWRARAFLRAPISSAWGSATRPALPLNCPIPRATSASSRGGSATDALSMPRLGKQFTGTRFMCTGHTLVVIGEAKDRFFMNADGGFLGRFRHQHFLLFLVAHFQRAALHMFSDRLVAAVSRLDIADAEANRVFR